MPTGRKRAPLPEPDTESVAAVDRRDEKRLAVWRDAQYEHIARRLLNHHPLKSIARYVGLSINEVRNIVRRADFRLVYDRVKQQVYKQVDEALYDQRRDIADRLKAGVPVALTELFLQIERGYGTGGTRPSERARSQAIELALGLAGHSVVEKRVVMEAPVPKLGEAQLDAMTRAFAFAMKRGEIIDVTPEPGDDAP